MAIEIAGAPCSWGVDDPTNPNLPPWELIFKEASQAGYRSIEIGPYGYVPLDTKRVEAALLENDLTIVAGTIFDDLVSKSNFEKLLHQVDDICSLITKLPPPPDKEGQKFPPPYLVIIDWGNKERDYDAGHYKRAKRLQAEDWDNMMNHIRKLANRAAEYGVRSVIHPHAGGFIEFEDEIKKLMESIPYEVAGLCLDTGHLYYSKMNPVEWLREHIDRVDYIHFKDINPRMYEKVMKERIRFFDACGKGVMCPIGQGIIDYKSINKLLKELNYHGYITIEQERDPRNSGTSLQDVIQSLTYLKNVGY